MTPSDELLNFICVTRTCALREQEFRNSTELDGNLYDTHMMCPLLQLFAKAIIGFMAPLLRLVGPPTYLAESHKILLKRKLYLRRIYQIFMIFYPNIVSLFIYNKKKSNKTIALIKSKKYSEAFFLGGFQKTGLIRIDLRCLKFVS